MDIKSKQKRGVVITVVLLLAFIMLVVGMLVRRVSMPTILDDTALRANGAYVFPKPRLIEPFTLIDHNGQTFSKEQLKGKWTLAFFGYTYCPDICPTTLVEIKNVYEQLKDTESADTQVLLISVDPERDTPEKLAAYVHYFHKDFIGVTGEFLNLYRFAKNVNVAFNKVPISRAGEVNNYSVDHSANIVLINPHGDYQGFFKPPFELATLKMTYRSIRASH